MPERKTLERAARDKRQGKSASTQTGEFIREIEHVRAGKHGVRSTKQAVAIGLSKARRAGVKLPAPNAPARQSSARPKGPEGSWRRPSEIAQPGARRRRRAEESARPHRPRRSRQASAAASQRSAAAVPPPRSKPPEPKGAAAGNAAAKKAARTRAANRQARHAAA